MFVPFGSSCRAMHHLLEMALSVGLLRSAVPLETLKNTFCWSVAAVLRAAAVQRATNVLDCDYNSPAKNLTIWWITGNGTTLYFWHGRVNNAQKEILETWKNKKNFVFKCVPREANGWFWSDFGGREAQGVELLLLLSYFFLLALFSSSATLVCLAVPPQGNKIVSALEGGRVMKR